MSSLKLLSGNERRCWFVSFFRAMGDMFLRADIFFYPCKEPEYAVFVSSAGKVKADPGARFLKKNTSRPKGGMEIFFQNAA